MGWDLGSWFGNILGTNQANQASDQFSQASGNINAASTALQGIQNKSASDYAKESGQAGQALGEQMGQTAATQGTRAATQAARTQGVNKGQSALLGSQQAGNLYTQGQQQGQGLGMQAYGQGANTQLGGAAALGNMGTNEQANAAQSQAASTKQGSLLFGGALSALAEGGVVDKPTPALVGEEGPEAIFPLSDRGYDLNLIQSKQTANPNTSDSGGKSDNNNGLDKWGKTLKEKLGNIGAKGSTASSGSLTGADIAGGVGSTGAELGASGAAGAGAAGAGAAGAAAGGAAAAGGLVGGIAELAPLVALAANGAVVDKPTLTMIGEKGPEVVLPLSNKKRMAEVMGEVKSREEGLDGARTILKKVYASKKKEKK